MRTDAAPTNDIHLFDTLQAKAKTNYNKAIDPNGIAPEMFKSLPFEATITIHKQFKELYDNATPHPKNWENTIYVGVPKTRTTNTLDKFRWLAQLSLSRQWYSRAWIHTLRHDPSRADHTVRTYGFKP